MGLFSLSKTETRLTTPDEIINAVLDNWKLPDQKTIFYNGIRLVRFNKYNSESTFMYGTNELSICFDPGIPDHEKYQPKIRVKLNSNTVIDIYAKKAIMWDDKSKPIDIDYDVFNCNDFSQYDFLFVKNPFSVQALVKLKDKLKGSLENVIL